MADQSLQFNLNLDLRKGNNESVTSNVHKFAYQMENYIIENAAFIMAKNQQAALQSVISEELSLIVEKELQRMGRQIDQFVVGIPDRSTRGKTSKDSGQSVGPPGSLKITGAISQAMRNVNMGPYSLVSGTGPWPARSPGYLARKKKKVGHTKWFETTGRMKKQLRDPNTYTSAYGPVKVTFKKNQIQDPTNRAIKMSSGASGRKERKIVVGQVKASVLGRISSDMLNDPGQRQPSPWQTGLFSSLSPDLEAKLLNREDAYRPFLEHFLSFYLTRAIPNAVFRRLEQVVKFGVQRKGAVRYSSKNLAVAAASLKT